MIKRDSRAVKIPEERIVTAILEIQSSHETADAEHIRTHDESSQDHGKPHKRALARERWAQERDDVPQDGPQRPDILAPALVVVSTENWEYDVFLHRALLLGFATLGWFARWFGFLF